MSNIKTIKISDYYKDIDLPKKCFLDNNIRNLLELTAMNDIKLFSYAKKRYKLNKKENIIKECNKMKKIKLKELTKELSDYNVKENEIDSNFLQGKNNEYINNIKSIDKIIKIIKNEDELENLDTIVKDNNYIEIFSNN